MCFHLNNSHTRKHKKKNRTRSIIKTILLFLVLVMAAGAAIASYYLKKPSEFWEKLSASPLNRA